MFAIPPETPNCETSALLSDARQSISVSSASVAKIFHMWNNLDRYDLAMLEELRKRLQLLQEQRMGKPLFFEVITNITDCHLLLLRMPFSEAEELVVLKLSRGITALVDNNYQLSKPIVDYRHTAVHGALPDPQWTLTTLNQLDEVMKTTVYKTSDSVSLEYLRCLQTVFVGNISESRNWSHSSKSAKLAAIIELTELEPNPQLLEIFEKFLEESLQMSHQAVAGLLLARDELIMPLEKVSPRAAQALRSVEPTQFSCELESVFEVNRSTGQFIIFSLGFVFDTKSLVARVTAS